MYFIKDEITSFSSMAEDVLDNYVQKILAKNVFLP